MNTLVAEHDQTLVGRQDYNSVGETAICYLCFADWSKESCFEMSVCSTIVI